MVGPHVTSIIIQDSDSLSSNTIQMVPNQAKGPQHPSQPFMGLGKRYERTLTWLMGWANANHTSTVTPIITQHVNFLSDNVTQLIPIQQPHHPSPPPIAGAVECKSQPYPLNIAKKVIQS